MKVKYVIEASPGGYTEEVYINGELKNKVIHNATPGGTKMAAGCVDNHDALRDYPDVSDALENFVGFDIFMVCNGTEDDES